MRDIVYISESATVVGKRLSGIRHMMQDGHRRALGVELSQGITRGNLWAYLLVAFVSSAYAGAMATLQPGLLAVIGIDMKAQGMATGLLSALQEIVLIVALGPIGALADKIGRRPIYVFGLLMTALGFALYPFAGSLPQLAMARVIVALGSAAMIGMMVTVIADYTTNRTRGHANGLQGFIATLGAFLPPLLAVLPATFVGKGLDELAAQRATFAVAGSLGIIGAAIAILGLAKGTPQGSKPVSVAAPKLSIIMAEGFASITDRGIALSYASAFISRGDLAVTGAFVFLWLVQAGTRLGMTPSAAMGTLAAPRIFMVVGGAMIGSLLMGWLADRITKVTAIALAAGLASLAYLGMGFVTDPTAPWVFGLLGVMGVAEISAFVSSQALVGERAPPERRGAIMGFFGVAGAIGILIATLGGGVLFSKIAPAAPFVLFGCLNLVVFAWALWLRAKEAGQGGSISSN
jgi:MFS family permease